MTETFSQHSVPLPFAEITAGADLLEHTLQEVYLYHGTNCYRRWEINRTGNMSPGRSGYSFFSNNEEAAYDYAKNACLRDARTGATNSLICEPVVLKVRFNERSWIQVDFVTRQRPAAGGRPEELSIAVLGPIPSIAIVAITHCLHARSNMGKCKPVRSFADGTLTAGTRRLRQKADLWRLDAWLLERLQHSTYQMSLLLSGHRTVALTATDELHRLSQLTLSRHSSSESSL